MYRISSLFFLLVVLVLLFFLIHNIMKYRTLGRASKKVVRLFSTIEQQYRDFIEQRITLSVLQTDSLELELERIKKEALVVIKPQIEALIETINSNNNPNVELRLESETFVNAVSLTESLMQQAAARPEKRIPQRQERKLMSIFDDAIAADLNKRHLALQRGNI